MSKVTHNHRLDAAMAYKAKKRKQPRRDQLFTTASATAANARRYAGTPRKPQTATIRVESDIVELLKALPRDERVARVSAIIRAAMGSEIAEPTNV